MASELYQKIKSLVDKAVKSQVNSPATAKEKFEQHKNAAVRALLGSKYLQCKDNNMAEGSSPRTDAIYAFTDLQNILKDTDVPTESYIEALPDSIWDAVQMSEVDGKNHILALSFTAPSTLVVDLPEEDIGSFVEPGSVVPGSLETSALDLRADGITWKSSDPFVATVSSVEATWAVVLDLKKVVADMATFVHVVEKSDAILPGFWAAAYAQSSSPDSILQRLRLGNNKAYVHDDNLAQIKEWGKNLPEWGRGPLTIRNLKQSDCLMSDDGDEHV
jgi:hypothetical protein